MQINRSDVEELSGAFVACSLARAKGALSSMKRLSRQEGDLAQSFGMALERGLANILDDDVEFGIDGEATNYNIDSVVLPRFGFLGASCVNAARMALLCAGDDASLQEEIGECCARMGESLAGSEAHWRWMGKHGIDCAADDSIPLRVANPIQKSFHGSFSIFVAMREAGLALGDDHARRMLGGFKEIYDLGKRRFTSFGVDVHLVGHEEMVWSDEGFDYGKALGALAALDESLQVANGLASGKSSRGSSLRV